MRPRDALSAGCGAAAIAIAIFAIGGATRWSQALVAIVLAIALAPIIPSRRVFGRISPLVAMLGIAAGLTALQLVPLPHGLIAWLDPTGASLREDGASLVGVSPWSAISLDAPSTLRALTFFVSLLAVAVIALRMAASENGRYRILATVAALCGLTAVVAGVHSLVGATSLYGVYEPRVLPIVLAPLLNGNHFGCLMAVGAVLAISLAMYPRQRAWVRASWLAVVGVCGVALLATLSRGASLALAAGAFVTIGVLVGQRFVAHETPRRRRAGFLTSSLPIGVVAVCAVIVVLYASAGGVAQQLSHTSMNELNAPRSKFVAWRSAGTLIDESPWVGVGRGAFEPVFTRVHAASGLETYSHLENEYLQAVVDWGVPGALLLGLATAWLLVVAIRRWRDGPLAAGALGALVAVMLQSNVDFGIELLGLAVPMTAIAATVAYVPIREASTRERALGRAIRSVHVAALALAALLLLSHVTTSVGEDHRALEDRRSLSLADLQGPLERHPLDYYSYELAAQVMVRTNDPRAIRVLNHALTLHPTHPGLHLMAARLLYGAGYVEQATIEYAAAIPATQNKRRLLGEIVARFPRALAAAAIPPDVTALDEITTILEDLHRPDVAVEWITRILTLRPNTMHACELLFTLATRRGDLAIVAEANRRCTEYQPSQESRLALARLLLARHGETEMVKLLGDVETWQGRADEKAEAWLLLCDARSALGQWDEAKRCLRRLDASPSGTPERASQIAQRLEKLQDAREAAARGSGAGSGFGSGLRH